MKARRALAALIAAALHAGALAATIDYKIVTAPEGSTAWQAGRDLARWVAPAAGIALEVAPSAGSAEDVQRLRYEPGVKLALVQSDVYQAFLDQATAGNAQARALIRPLRVVLPLYDQEVHFIARADAPFDDVGQIRDARIAVGPLLGGAAITATTVYRELFGRELPGAQTSTLGAREALAHLVGDRSVDVVVVVDGQPSRLLADMKPAARKLVKLLRFDTAAPAAAGVLQTYWPATLRAASYPSLLAADLPALAVRTYLVTYDYTLDTTLEHLTRLASSLCRNLGRLQAQGHPKWREVKLAQPDLGPGWSYLPATARVLRECAGSALSGRTSP